MFNPLKDHERYAEKDPRDMSLDELRMLLKIKRLDLQLEWNVFQGKIRFWQRVGRTIKQSGFLEKIQEGLQAYRSQSSDNHPPGDQNSNL
ncbi:hypothetical protein EHQ58_04495 [Leptospira ognonensis]|uniref:Uncharacterized protein n=1 Tax=Leptospira ognonensis TaxID=2484945 RepID=A0A4R9KAP6_9LEPT|nr:hypothetical protein [Leptospira ognonensis]TGL61874.1 hypothetical protein EHQ58_04495 [Leptospira ognonensis]